MKPILSFIAFCILAISASAQLAPPYLVATVTHEHNGTAYMLVDSSRLEYTTLRFRTYIPLIETWDCDTLRHYTMGMGGQLEESSKATLTWDMNNNPLTVYSQRLDMGAWVDMNKYTRSFDANNNILSEQYDDDQGTGTLQKVYNAAYTYDANDNILNVQKDTWDGSQYVPESRSTYTYTGTVLDMILEERYISSAWQPTVRTTFTYGTGTKTEVREHYGVGPWQYANRITHTYDGAGNETSTEYENYGMSGYVKSFKTVMTYNGNNGVMSIEVLFWNGSMYEPDEKTMITYGPFDFITSSVLHGWDNSTSQYRPGLGSDSTSYIYEYYTSVPGSPAANAIQVRAYPSPASSHITLQAATSGRLYTACIYNMQGKLVKTYHALTARMQQLDVADLPTGHYILQVAAGADVHKQKILIAR